MPAGEPTWGYLYRRMLSVFAAAGIRRGCAHLGAAEAGAYDAPPYLQAFGHVVLAWLWLDVALATVDDASDAAHGRRSAMRYFFVYELPRVEPWLAAVRTREAVCRQMHDAWF